MDTQDISESDRLAMMNYVDVNQENVAERYNQNAEKYEHIHRDVLGYPDPSKVHEMVVKYGIPKDAAILDFGCGTGLVGREMIPDGYTNIVGIDASSEMLAKAESVGYKELKEVFCCSNSFPQEYVGKFDVAVSAGFLLHELPAEIIEEKMSCLRPKESDDDKRYIIFATRETCMDIYGYGDKIKELEEAGKLKVEETASFKRFQNIEGKGEVGIFRTLTACVYVLSI